MGIIQPFDNTSEGDTFEAKWRDLLRSNRGDIEDALLPVLAEEEVKRTPTERFDQLGAQIVGMRELAPGEATGSAARLLPFKNEPPSRPPFFRDSKPVGFDAADRFIDEPVLPPSEGDPGREIAGFMDFDGEIAGDVYQVEDECPGPQPEGIEGVDLMQVIRGALLRLKGGLQGMTHEVEIIFPYSTLDLILEAWNHWCDHGCGVASDLLDGMLDSVLSQIIDDLSK